MKKTTLCEKIHELYPEVGECGEDLAVRFDEAKHAWAVELRQGSRRLKTYLDEADTSACLEEERCVDVGVKVSQLLENVGQA